MKTFVISVYNEFDTAIVPQTQVQQVDGLMGAPVDNVVMLGFKRVA